MRKDLLQRRAKSRLVIAITCAGLTLATHTNAGAQKKQLITTGPVQKIACLDHSAVRKGYKVFADARAAMAKDAAMEKKSFDQEVRLLEQKTKDLVKQDSLKGGKARGQIMGSALSRRSELASDFQLKQKNRDQQRILMMQEFEKKIILAIDAVVNEGGYTDVKPTTKGQAIKDGTDITDMVLKKLN